MRRGLLFMALCADIERQFEFIQRIWLDAIRRLTRDANPLLGRRNSEARERAADDAAPRTRAHRYMIPTAAAPVEVRGLESCGSLRGGGYFSLPSRTSVQYLVTGS